MELTLQRPTDLSMPRSKGIVVGFWIVTALFCLQIGFTAYAQLQGGEHETVGCEPRPVVTFTLTPTASGTRLSLVHAGFEPEQNFGGARYGWKMMGGKLVDPLARLP